MAIRGLGAKTEVLNSMVGTLNSARQLASRIKRIEDSVRHFEEFPEKRPGDGFLFRRVENGKTF